jgi:hypothetical protein
LWANVRLPEASETTPENDVFELSAPTVRRSEPVVPKVVTLPAPANEPTIWANPPKLNVVVRVRLRWVVRITFTGGLSIDRGTVAMSGGSLLGTVVNSATFSSITQSHLAAD